jgi:deoxyadenosine/deoxycytidine kinase
MIKGYAAVQPTQLKVAVVGPCASGKTTLVRNLREHGYDAFVVAQEHSAIPALWARQHPDVLIALHADLSTIRQRRGAGWSEDIYAAQIQRLSDAYNSADLRIDTTEVPEQSAVEQSLTLLQSAVPSGWKTADH